MKHLLKSGLTLASLGCGLFTPFVLTAQPFVDVLNVKAQYFPGRAHEGNSADSLSTVHYEAGFLLPLEQKDKSVILAAGNFTQLGFNYKGTPPDRSNLYSTFLALGYEKPWKKPGWKSLLMAIPKINSDFKAETTSDFQMGGLVLIAWQKTDSLRFRVGLYYNREFFGNYFMPIVGIDWKINSRFYLFGELPANLNLEYKVSKKFYAGMAYLSVVNSYRLSNGNYVREGEKFWGYDQFKICMNYYLTKHLVWYAEAGISAGRLYKVYTSAHEEVISYPLYGKDLDGPVVNTGIAYRFRLDE